MQLQHSAEKHQPLLKDIAQVKSSAKQVSIYFKSSLSHQNGYVQNAKVRNS